MRAFKPSFDRVSIIQDILVALNFKRATYLFRFRMKGEEEEGRLALFI